MDWNVTEIHAHFLGFTFTDMLFSTVLECSVPSVVVWSFLYVNVSFPTFAKDKILKKRH